MNISSYVNEIKEEEVFWVIDQEVLSYDVNIFTWESNQWELINYQHHPFIKAPVAV